MIQSSQAAIKNQVLQALIVDLPFFLLFLTQDAHFTLIVALYIKYFFERVMQSHCNLFWIFMWLSISSLVFAYDKRGFEKYNRAQFGCGNQCEEKGYFKQVCTKMCLSMPCFREIYLNDVETIRGKLQFDLKKDPLEVSFRNCWLQNWKASKQQ